MELKTIPVGYLAANCYLLIQDKECIIIDPGAEKEKIVPYLEGLKVVGLLVTHHHFDHVGELNYFIENYHLQINSNIPNFSYETIKTPGHSKDSLTFYFPKYNIMFTGDFLFNGTIGRMDLPTGNEEDMQNSLKIIAKYDDNITIYPGHGNASTLGTEKARFKYYF